MCLSRFHNDCFPRTRPAWFFSSYGHPALLTCPPRPFPGLFLRSLNLIRRSPLHPSTWQSGIITPTMTASPPPPHASFLPPAVPPSFSASPPTDFFFFCKGRYAVHGDCDAPPGPWGAMVTAICFFFTTRCPCTISHADASWSPVGVFSYFPSFYQTDWARRFSSVLAHLD